MIEIPGGHQSIDEDGERDEFVPIKQAFGAHHLFWLNCLQQVEDGKIKRLMGLMPPGSGKSIYSSVVFPTHFLGRFSNKQVLVASYGDKLPKKFGRRARSIVQQPKYKRIFDCTLSAESQAVDEWSLTNGSEWMAAGILTGITGNRVDGCVWDDLIKGREQADSETVRTKTWDAYVEDLLTRKKPGAFEVAVNCMAGGTPVTMSDGTRKNLSDIKIGDQVLSWYRGRAISRKVLNFKAQGKDKVFEVRTGGSRVKANARHPFLVLRGVIEKNSKAGIHNWSAINGNAYKWVRTEDLKVGDFLVTSSRIPGRAESVLSPDQAWLLGYMFGDGWITIRNTTQKGYKGHTYPRRGFVTSCALTNFLEDNDRVGVLFKSLFGVNMKRTKYQTQVTEVARVGRWFVEHGLVGKAKTKRLPAYLFSEPEHIRLAFLDGYNHADGYTVPDDKKGAGSWSLSSCNVNLLEDARQLARGVGYRVTNVYVKQKWMQAPNSPKPTFSTSAMLNFRGERSTKDFFVRPITSIKACEEEEVFDIQVEDTECFIADGLVSHNTRWHEDDPAGRILPLHYAGESGWVKGQDGNDWYVVCLPAECERSDDLLGRQIGEILWPEWFGGPEFFAPFKRVPRTWNALYQQRPAPETGDFFQADWLKPYHKIPDRRTLNIYGASDYAVTQDDGDYTVHMVVGVDPAGHVYLLDLWRSQASPDKWIESFCDMVAFWKPIGWAEETGQIKVSIGPFLEKRLRERQLFIARAKFPSRTDKAVRAQAIRGRMAMDGLYVPMHAPWFPEFKRELMTFPAARHDDMVDCLSLIGQILDKMISGNKVDPSANKIKVLSAPPDDPRYCGVSLEELFEANEQRVSKVNVRIH